MKRLSLVELVVYGAAALIMLAACVAGQCHAEQAQSIWNLYSETIPKDGWAVDSQVTVGPGKSIVQPKRTAALSPWDVPYTIRYRVPMYDSEQCRDSAEVGTPEGVTSVPWAGTVVVECRSWRSFVFTFHDSTRGDIVERVVMLPPGFYLRSMRASDASGVNCWTEQRSMVARAQRPGEPRRPE